MSEVSVPSSLFYDAARGVSEEIAESVADAKNYDPTVTVVGDNEIIFGTPERLLTRKNGEAVIRIANGYKETLQQQFGYRTELRMDDSSVRVWVKTGAQDVPAGWEKFETRYADFMQQTDNAA